MNFPFTDRNDDINSESDGQEHFLDLLDADVIPDSSHDDWTP